MADANPSAAELRACFSYDPQNGFITRINGQRPSHTVGFRATNGYLTVTYKGRGLIAHRLAWCLATGGWPLGQIDHINGAKTDNRLANLRDVSPHVNSQNQHHARRNNLTAALGVTETKSGRFMARTFVAGHRHYLGLHDTPAAAQAAYKNAKSGKEFTHVDFQADARESDVSR